MCAGEDSLEGKTDSLVWTDFDALLSWVNEHTVVEWKKNMLSEAVL